MAYTIQRHQYKIHHFFLDLKNNEFTFPKWQREDCWKEYFKKSLIRSILLGIDLPKFYIGNIEDTELKYIIDGGHRSRSIKGFCENEFSIKLDGVDVYYNKVFSITTRNKRSLSKEEKKLFDNYHLDIVEYDSISENKCREIFNILQNAQPMSIDDVINSHQSDLVDLARELVDTEINDKLIREHFQELKFIQKPETSSIMGKLIGWYTILNPMLSGSDLDKEKEEVSLLYLTKGNNNNSPCLQYVKNYTDSISSENKQIFIELLTWIITYCMKNNVSPSDLNTLIHAKVNHSTFSLDKFNKFLECVSSYEGLKKLADTLHTNKKYNDSQCKYKEADELNNRFNKHLQTWVFSRKNGGNNPSGMRKRYEIIKVRCLN